MSTQLGAVCDEFYVSARLFLKLELMLGRETVLHFFDQLRKNYPGLRKLRRRDQASLVLEEDPVEVSSRRWVRLDPSALRFGQFAPPDMDDVRRYCDTILQQAPYHLSFSELDYDHLELVYGFDLEYRGNHDQLVAETLWGDHPAAAGFLQSEQAQHIIDAQPYFGIALSPECDLQAYVEIKSRTSTYEVRSGAYEPQPISVYLTIRKYWGLEGATAPDKALAELFEVADELATERVVPLFVNPLAAAIASRS